MTSRISFWTSLVEDFKRRNWVVAITGLVLFFAYPVRLAVLFNGIKSTWDEGYQRDEFLSFAHQVEYEFTKNMLLDPFIGFVALAIAVLCAIQGFSYLYKKQKVDLFYSVPVTKGKRFATVYINGILIFTFTLLVNLLLGILVAFLYGAVTAQAIVIAFMTFGLLCLLFLALYNITLIAVMMTGNLVVTCLGTVVFFCYEAFIKYLVAILQMLFFDSFYPSMDSLDMVNMVTSPFAIWFHIMKEISIDYNVVIGYSTDSIGNIMHLVLLILVSGVLAYYLHGKRPAEASERAMAFTKSKMIIKILISVPVSMFAGTLFYSMTGENSWFLLFGLMIGAILTHCLFEVIYDFDFKAVLRHKRQLLLSGVITAALFSIFYFDLTDYDSYVPEADKVESIAISWYSGGDSNNYDMEEKHFQGSIWQQDYQMENMKLTDVDEILQLAVIGMNNHKKDIDLLDFSKTDDLFYIDIKYMLENGKEVYRSIWVEGEESLEILKSIYEMQEFKLASYQFLDNEAMNKVDSENVTMKYIENDQTSAIMNCNMKEFLDIYKEEFLNYSYDSIINSLPIGKIAIEEGVKHKFGGYDIRVWHMPVYKEFTKTIAYLEEEDLRTIRVTTAENIQSIEILNFNREIEEQAEADKDVFVIETELKVGFGYEIKHDYTQISDIEEILPYLHRNDLNWNRFAEEKLLEEDYRISISQFGSENDYNNGAKYYYNGEDNNYQFLKGQVPEFVKKDTTYVESE